MSNTKQTYHESYQFIRKLMRGAFPPIPIIAYWQSDVLPFANALISWNNRHVPDNYVWKSWHRWHKWHNRPVKSNFDDYPF